MYSFTNVSKSRTLASNAIRTTSFVAIVSCFIISESSDAGLIEAVKETACQAFSANEKSIAGSGHPPANDPATNQVQALSLILTHTRNLINASSVHSAKTVDLSAVLGSKDLGITPSDIKMALVNAHVYARLKLSSADSINCESLFCVAKEVVSRNDNQVGLSSQFKSYGRDHVNQLLVFSLDDSAVFLHGSASLESDERRTTSQSTTPTFVTTFVTGNHTTENASRAQVPPRAKKGQELLDKDEYSEGCDDEPSDEESTDDLVAENDRLLLADVDSFDPFMALVAFLIFGAIAIVVTAVPRRVVLTTQL